MSFEIDMAELLKAKKAYEKSVEEARKSMATAQKSLKNIHESHVMEGEVGKAIAGEITNFHDPTLTGLMDAIEILGREFTGTIAALQSGLSENSETAVIKESTLSKATRKLTSIKSQHDVQDENFKAIYNSIQDLLPLTNPSSSGIHEAITDAKNDIQDIKDKVATFEAGKGESSSERLLTGMESTLNQLGDYRDFSYMDPTIQHLSKQTQYASVFNGAHERYEQAKKEQAAEMKRMKEEAERKQKEEYARHHPWQNWIKEKSEGLGRWWQETKEGLQKLDLPPGLARDRDQLVMFGDFMDGMREGAETAAVGAVDAGQLFVELGEWGLNSANGQKTPDWIMKDINGAWENTKGMASLAVGYTLYTLDPSVELRRAAGIELPLDKWKLDSHDKVNHLVEEAWDYVSHMDAKKAGRLTFEVASLLVGPGEIKALAGLKEAGMAGKVASKVTWAEKLADAGIDGQHLLSALDKGTDFAHLADQGVDVARLEKLGVTEAHLSELAKVGELNEGLSLSEALAKVDVPEVATEVSSTGLLGKAREQVSERVGDVREWWTRNSESLAEKVDLLKERGSEEIRAVLDKERTMPEWMRTVRENFAPEYAFAGGGALQAPEKMSISDFFSFMSNKSDDAARAGSGAGRKFVRTEEFSDDVTRATEKAFDKEYVLKNLRESRLARESSNFNEYVAKEKNLLESIERNKRFEAFGKGELSFVDVLPDYAKVYAELVNNNEKWTWSKNFVNSDQLSKGQKYLIKRLATQKGYIPEVKVKPSQGMKYGFADFKGANVVQETVQLPEELWLKSDREQFTWLNDKIGGARKGMTWHHTEIPGKMELVPFGIHNITLHNGGRSTGLWAYAPR